MKILEYDTHLGTFTSGSKYLPIPKEIKYTNKATVHVLYDGKSLVVIL